MLKELHLKNYILIDELNLSFEPGMSVLTGETGAGKSILVGALNLVFGKSSAQSIAYKSDKDVFLEISFTVPDSYLEVHKYLENAGFPAEDNIVVISKEITPNGKSTSYLNGRKTTTSIIKELHDLLIDFHHQRDQQNLLNPGFQLDILDSYCGLFQTRSMFKQNLHALKHAMQELMDAESEKVRNNQLTELYRFQLDELNSAQLTAGEDSELEQEFILLTHSEDIINLSTEAYGKFYENEDSIHDAISSVLTQLQKYSGISSKVSEVCNVLEVCLENVYEAADEFRNLHLQIDNNPEKLEFIRQRLDTLNHLKTKYKKTSIQELLSYKDGIERAIGEQDNKEAKIAEITERVDRLFEAVRKLADDLSDKRMAAARKLERDIVKNIKKLSIPNARFEIEIDKITHDKLLLTNIGKSYTDFGQDVIEFRFSANPGSPVLPLKLIVSGGELSRILLATKKTLAAVMPPRTMILDEIDSGIGGKTAGSMAQFIHELAADYQIVCITHLAKVAASADWHYSVEKKTVKGGTYVTVELLSADRRRQEIARMLSGQITELSIKHADELLSIR